MLLFYDLSNINSCFSYNPLVLLCLGEIGVDPLWDPGTTATANKWGRLELGGGVEEGDSQIILERWSEKKVCVVCEAGDKPQNNMLL